MKYIEAELIRRFYVDVMAELKRQGVDHETIAIVRSVCHDIYNLPAARIECPKCGERIKGI